MTLLSNHLMQQDNVYANIILLKCTNKFGNKYGRLLGYLIEATDEVLDGGFIGDLEIYFIEKWHRINELCKDVEYWSKDEIMINNNPNTTQVVDTFNYEIIEFTKQYMEHDRPMSFHKNIDRLFVNTICHKKHIIYMNLIYLQFIFTITNNWRLKCLTTQSQTK